MERGGMVTDWEDDDLLTNNEAVSRLDEEIVRMREEIGILHARLAENGPGVPENDELRLALKRAHDRTRLLEARYEGFMKRFHRR